MQEYPTIEGTDRVEEHRQRERQTMQRRIEAFYRQSGGPSSPEIDRFMEKHLRYGGDHGDYGHKETIEDAFQDAILEDKSLLTLYELFMRWRSQREEESSKNTYSPETEERISRLEDEVRRLRELLETALGERQGDRASGEAGG